VSEWRHVLITVLLLGGCAVVVISCCAMLALRTVYDQLHLLAPVTSLGGPLIGAALVLQNGWGLTSGQVILIVALLALSGPAAGVATARAAHERDLAESDGGPE
jgi:multisubunit Na+/H+ antiporter MnhG subunit